eukprot:scaffold252255_cov32-Tisochrysis_lutea.AAC.3
MNDEGVQVLTSSVPVLTTKVALHWLLRASAKRGSRWILEKVCMRGQVRLRAGMVSPGAITTIDAHSRAEGVVAVGILLAILAL